MCVCEIERKTERESRRAVYAPPVAWVCVCASVCEGYNSSLGFICVWMGDKDTHTEKVIENTAGSLGVSALGERRGGQDVALFVHRAFHFTLLLLCHFGWLARWHSRPLQSVLGAGHAVTSWQGLLWDLSADCFAVETCSGFIPGCRSRETLPQSQDGRTSLRFAHPPDHWDKR